MKPDLELRHERMLASYNQNYETFRSLNNLMWQIPLIAMTLTGGLWFGVSKVENYLWFQAGLLLLALAGNAGLIVVLWRLRFIMGCYLDWMKEFNPEGHVAAVGTRFLTRSKTVRTAFQLLLALAALISGGLMLSIAGAAWNSGDSGNASLGSVSYYDRHAAALADEYEGVSFERAHPRLAERLRGATPLWILDVGAGTGRDAAWMAAAGHQVVAVEPSEAMLRLARSLHAEVRVDWRRGALPRLDAVGGRAKFDIILLSAVWMHVDPRHRAPALARLQELLAPNGVIYLTLREGPAARDRPMFETGAGELEHLASGAGIIVEDLGIASDLLGRRDVQWRTLVLRPAGSRNQ